MIKITNDENQIIKLWHDVFGDSEEYIKYFLNDCQHKICLGYYKEEKLVSMLFLIDCKYMNLNGKYIYAVCTDENYRSNGYAGQLIEKAKEYMNDFLWLIPANDSLFGYYEKFGFITKLYSNKNFEYSIEFDENLDITNDLYEGCSNNPKGMVFSVNQFQIGNIRKIK